MADHSQIVKLFAEQIHMFAVLVLQNVLNQLVVGVQDQSFSAAEHTQIHAVHAVHLHHILHSAAFLGEGNHGGDILVLHLLYFYVQLVIAESLLEGFGQSLGCLLKLLIIVLDLFLEGAV